MSETDKKRFDALAARDKARFSAELAQWKVDNPGPEELLPHA